MRYTLRSETVMAQLEAFERQHGTWAELLEKYLADKHSVDEIADRYGRVHCVTPREGHSPERLLRTHTELCRQVAAAHVAERVFCRAIGSDVVEFYEQMHNWYDGLPDGHDFTKDFSKLDETRATLSWGCRLKVVWTEEADFERKWSKEAGPDGEDLSEDEVAEAIVNGGDDALLIGVPGFSCDSPYETGVVWCPEVPAEKDKGDPAWVPLVAMLRYEHLERLVVMP